MKAFEEEIFIRKEDFKDLCKRKNLPLPRFWFASTGSQKRSFIQPKDESAGPRNSTRAATEARQLKAKQRLELVATFLSEMERRARDGNRNWDRSEMPFTTDDFCQVAKRQCPELEEFSKQSIVESVGELGGKFMRGSKSKPQNALALLFPQQK